MAKVITSILKFPPDQAQKVLEKEDSKVTVSICLAAEGSLCLRPVDNSGRLSSDECLINHICSVYAALVTDI